MASYDVFLSYNNKDRADVEQIARRLAAKGLKVWYDQWELVPGELLQEGILRGVEAGNTVVVFLGPEGLGNWENAEMLVALDKCFRDSSRRIFLLLLPGAPNPETVHVSEFICQFVWVDFRADLNSAEAFRRLVSGIEGKPPGHSNVKRLPKTGELSGPGPLPPGSRVPFLRNAVFTGREGDLKALARVLLHTSQKSGAPVTQAITCMIGIGKTELAVEFCYRYGRYFQGVHWINAQEQGIEAEIAACGAKMELPYWPEATSEQAQVTLRFWQKNGPRLLILDCVEGPELLRKWLPVLSEFRLLVTTRHHDWPLDLGLQTHPLNLLSLSEGLTLLRKLAPRLEQTPDAKLEDVVEQLGNLPLVLDLAGRYLNVCKSLTPQDYLRELEDAGGVLKHTSLLDWAEDKNPTNHETNLKAAFLLIWQKLQINDEKSVDVAARKIFLVCGYCAPNMSIPNKIIYDIVEGNKRLADRALKRLCDLGLLDEGPVMHPLLAEFARDQDSGKKSLKALVNVLAKLSYSANKTGQPASFVPLCPHVEATARYANNAKDGFHKRTALDDLWGNLGTHYRIVAEFEKAKDADHAALTIDEEIYGSIDTRTALRLNNLGRILQVVGDLGGAKEHYKHALTIDEAALGPEHPTVALRLNNLGMLMKDLGDLKGAKEKIEQALAIDEKASGSTHPNVARDVNNLGWILKDMYDLQGALDAFERARAIDEATFGPNHPNVARDIISIGWVLKDCGKFKEALEAFEHACNIDKMTFGPHHPDVARDINNIGWALRELGRFAEALDTFEHARAIDEEVYGSNHPAVAKDINNIGVVLKDLGKLQEAQETFMSVLALYEKVYHPNHPEVATVVNHIGVLMKGNGKLEEAKQHFERALDIDEKVFGSDHLAFARDIHNLGLVLKDLGDVERGEQLVERARGIHEKSLPVDHPLILAVHENLEIF